jgi:hypothetical protein
MIQATSLKVAVNKASGAGPGALGAATPLNWNKAIDLDATAPAGTGFGARSDAVSVGGTAVTFAGELLRAEGSLTLNALGFVKADAGFVLEIKTVDVNFGLASYNNTATEYDLKGAKLTTLMLQVSNLYIGVPDSVGFQLSSGTLVLAMLKPAVVAGSTDTRSWFAMAATLLNATLAGLPSDFVVTVNTLGIEINKASGAPTTGGTAASALNWTTQVGKFVNDTFVTQPVTITRTDPITGNVVAVTIGFTAGGQKIFGTLDFDAFGFVKLTAAFTFEQTTI